MQKFGLMLCSLFVCPAAAVAAEPGDTPGDMATLPEVKITAQRSPDQVSKTVISGKQLRKIAGTSGDPLKGLETLPGVVSSSFSNQPAVRGSGPQDNAYYVDDLPVGKIFHTGGISVFNADLVQDFNLYSAAFAPHYRDITGAVIDVALREPRKDRTGYKLNVNLLGADALAEGPVNENQSFYFAARRSYVDLFVKSIERKSITVQIPSYADYQGKYLMKLDDNNKLTLHLQGANDRLKINVGGNSNLAKQDPVLAGNIALADQSHMQAVTLDSVLFDSAANKLALEHSLFDFTNSIASAGNLYVAQEDWRMRERVTLPVHENHELSLGSTLNRTLVNIDANIKNATCTQFNPNCNISNATQQKLLDSFITNGWDASAQDRMRVSNTVTLVGGMRHSYEDYLRKSYTEPRLGLEYQHTAQTLYTAGWGRHNQMPSGQEIARVFGNPHLEHLRADHSVIGVSHKLDEAWSWKAESYYKKLRNLTVDDPVLNYTNSGSGRAYGLELLIKKDGNEAVTGWFSLSLARSYRHNDLTGQAFRYALDQPVNATWVANMKLEDGWSVGGKWHLHSGTPYTPIFGSRGVYPNGSNIPNYGAINSGTLPVFHQLDVRLQREAEHSKNYVLNYYVEMNNVYQRKNVVGYSYDPSYTVQDPVYPFVLPISFGVQAEF